VIYKKLPKFERTKSNFSKNWKWHGNKKFWKICTEFNPKHYLTVVSLCIKFKLETWKIASATHTQTVILLKTNFLDVLDNFEYFYMKISLFIFLHENKASSWRSKKCAFTSVDGTKNPVKKPPCVKTKESKHNSDLCQLFFFCNGNKYVR